MSKVCYPDPKHECMQPRARACCRSEAKNNSASGKTAELEQQAQQQVKEAQEQAQEAKQQVKEAQQQVKEATQQVKELEQQVKDAAEALKQETPVSNLSLLTCPRQRLS